MWGGWGRVVSAAAALGRTGYVSGSSSGGGGGGGRAQPFHLGTTRRVAAGW